VLLVVRAGQAAGEDAVHCTLHSGLFSLWVNPHLLLAAAAIHLQDDEDARPGRKRLRASAFIDDIAGAGRVASR